MTRGAQLTLKLFLAFGLLGLVVWNGLVEHSFIKDDPFWKLVLLVVTGAAVLIDSAWMAISEYRARGAKQRQDEMRVALLPVLRHIARNHSLDVTMLGASVYVVSGFWRWQRLKRLDRYRMSDLPQESVVNWVKGKGAIGRAWDRDEITHVDWYPIRARWGSGALLDERSWDRVPTSDRLGFQFEEFRNIVDKYGEILAIPMIRNMKTVGVCAIDVPIRANAIGAILNEDFTVEMATEATALIQNVVGKS